MTDKPNKLKVHHSSKSGDWATPQELVDSLPFDFTLDVCATEETAKCKAFISPEQDALSGRWFGTCWMNPPYGREIGTWVDKAALEASLSDGTRVVCLLPARPDTKWFQTIWDKASAICFVRGRVKFDLGNGKTDPAPFPSVLAVFGLIAEREARGLARFGNCLMVGRHNLFLYHPDQ